MDERFLAKAMDQHGDAVYRLAVCRLDSIDDAEDVYQDTFLRLFQEDAAEGWDSDHLKAWLLRVAVNLCADIGRQRKRGGISLEDVAELRAPEDDTYPELWAAIRSLPEKQRVIFHLFYQEGYQTREIGQILHLRESTVRVNLHRAREALRKELKSSVS